LWFFLQISDRRVRVDGAAAVLCHALFYRKMLLSKQPNEIMELTNNEDVLFRNLLILPLKLE
jgi:hypothetical protein